VVLRECSGHSRNSRLHRKDFGSGPPPHGQPAACHHLPPSFPLARASLSPHRFTGIPEHRKEPRGGPLPSPIPHQAFRPPFPAPTAPPSFPIPRRHLRASSPPRPPHGGALGEGGVGKEKGGRSGEGGQEIKMEGGCSDSRSKSGQHMFHRTAPHTSGMIYRVVEDMLP
jgi:hypothetical protein